MDIGFNIIVFGSSGQICSPIINHLVKTQKDNILVISRNINKQILDLKLINKNINYIEVDLYNEKIILNILNSFAPDIIIYCLAGGSVRIKKHSWETIKSINLEIPILISKWIFQNNKQTLYITFGSTAEYMGYKNKSVITEKMPTSPISDYAISKSAAFNSINSILNANKLFYYFNLTLSSVYGGLEDQSRLIQKIYRGLKSNNEIQISNSNNKRDYVYVEDICQCISKLINLFRNNLLNNYSNERIFIASGFLYTNKEIFKIITKLMNKDISNIKYVMTNLRKNSLFNESLSFSNKKFINILGRFPKDIKDIKDINILVNN